MSEYVCKRVGYVLGSSVVGLMFEIRVDDNLLGLISGLSDRATNNIICVCLRTHKRYHIFSEMRHIHIPCYDKYIIIYGRDNLGHDQNIAG